MLLIRKLHKWFGLIVGLQLLLWAVSGLVFAWLDHHQVSAEYSVRLAEEKTLWSTIPIAEPKSWLGDERTHIYEIRLAPLLDQWVWRVEAADRVELRSSDGGTFELDEEFVRRLALSRYAGEGRLQSVVFHAGPTLETRDAGAVWQAQFDDEQRTTLYFAAEDGRLVAARNSTWRLFDFFWMLHTMDYRGRDNFNNPLVITIGFAALWLAVSGFLLLFKSFRRQDFAFVTGWRQK